MQNTLQTVGTGHQTPQHWLKGHNSASTSWGSSGKNNWVKSCWCHSADLQRRTSWAVAFLCGLLDDLLQIGKLSRESPPLYVYLVLCLSRGLSQTGSRVGCQTCSGSAVTLTIVGKCLKLLLSDVGHVNADIPAGASLLWLMLPSSAVLSILLSGVPPLTRYHVGSCSLHMQL